MRCCKSRLRCNGRFRAAPRPLQNPEENSRDVPRTQFARPSGIPLCSSGSAVQNLTVTPEEATQRQIERYRQMTPGERVELALRLHELASEVARCGIRAQHPAASPEEVVEKLRARRRLAY